MENNAIQAQGNSAGRRRALFWSNRRLQGLALLGALILVEMLPVEAWLIVFAGASHVGIARVATPLWYLVLVMALACAVAWRFERFGTGRVLLVSAPLLLVALLTLVRISPSAYGSVPLRLTGGGAGVLDPLLADLAHGLRQFGSDLGLTLVVAYVWWRGLMLGSRPPSFDEVVRRFQWSMVAFILALFGVTGASESVRASLFGAMSLLLPVEVFVCLTALALANVAVARQRSRGSQTLATEGRWLGSALLLAGLVATLALAINIFVNFESVSALLRQLGPVGVALDGAAHWLIGAFIQVLYVVFDKPLQFFFDWLQHHGQRPRPQSRASQVQSCPPQSSTPACMRPDALSRLNTVPRGVMITLDILVVAAILVVFAVLLRRMLARQTLEGDAIVQEEREAIGGRRLFGAQLRALFARSARGGMAVERLAAGSVRAVYRDVLRAAARQGVERTASETPDEYARRLVDAPLLAGAEAERGDVAALSEAYEGARYGEREPALKEQTALQGRGKRVIGRLRSQPPPAR